MSLVELGGLITEVYCQLKPKRSPTKKAPKAFQVGEELVAIYRHRSWDWDNFDSSGMVILYLQRCIGSLGEPGNSYFRCGNNWQFP